MRKPPLLKELIAGRLLPLEFISPVRRGAIMAYFVRRRFSFKRVIKEINSIYIFKIS
jgi:hypothetical protein